MLQVGEDTSIRQLWWGEWEDCTDKEKRSDIEETNWLREENHNKETIQGEEYCNKEYQINRDEENDKAISTSRG